MKVDAQEMIKKAKLKGESRRGRISLYVDKPLFKDFQVICEKEGVSASEIVEQFLSSFVASTKKRDK